MKKMTRHTRLLIWVLPLMFALAWSMYFLNPQGLIECTKVNWLALAFGLVIILSPLGSLRLKSHMFPREPLLFGPWLIRVLLLQAGLWSLYLGMHGLIMLLTPHDAPLAPDFWMEQLTLPLQTLGLFPFASIAVLAAAFGMIATRTHIDAYLDTTCLSTLKNPPSALSITIRAIGRALTLIGLAIMTVMATLAAAALFAGTKHVSYLLGLSLPGLGCAFLLFILCLRRNQNPMFLAVQKHRPVLGLILNGLIWAVILSLIAFIIPEPLSAPLMAMPNFVAALFSDHYWLNESLFSIIFWWMITPITAITLARLSYGYSLRAMILATLAPSAALLLLTHQHYLADPKNISPALTLIGFLVFLMGVLNQNTLPLVSQTYLSAGEIKHRSEMIFHERWKQLTGVIFYFFIPGGLISLAFVFSLLLIPAALILLLVMINLVRVFAGSSRNSK